MMFKLFAKSWICPIDGHKNPITERYCPRCGTERKEDREHYDAFISYRRAGGAEIATVIRLSLERFEKFGFMDVTELQEGRFDEKLLSVIENTPVFILVLSKGSLDRCKDKSDWLKREIVHALENNKKIIPVKTNNFTFPNEEMMQLLPDCMREIPRLNAIVYDHLNQDAVVRKILEFMSGAISEESARRHGAGPAPRSPEKESPKDIDSPPPPPLSSQHSRIEEKPEEPYIAPTVRPKSKLLVISLGVALVVILGGAVAYWSFTSKDKHAPIPAPESKTVALGLQQPNALTKTDNDLLPVHTVNGIIPSKSPNNQTSPQLFFRKDSICTLTDQELKEIKIYIDMLGRQDRVGPAAFGLSSIGVCCIKPLIEVLNDKAKLAGACTILSRFGEPAVMPLIEALKDKDRMIGACAALGWIGRPAIIPLIEALKHKDEKLGAIYALQDLQRMGQPVIKPLIEELKYDDKIGAMKCLELIGRPAIKPLVQALYNDSTRTGAMVLLGRMGEPALNDLFQALQSENKQVVLAAQISISDIKKMQSNR